MNLNLFFVFFRRSFGVFWGSTKKNRQFQNQPVFHPLFKLTPKNMGLLFVVSGRNRNQQFHHLFTSEIPRFSPRKGAPEGLINLVHYVRGTQLCHVDLFFFVRDVCFFGGKAEEPYGARVSGRSKLRRINEFNLCLVFFFGEWVPGSIYRVSGLLQFVHHCLGTIMASIFYIFICNYDHLLPLFVLFGVNVLFVQSCIIKMLNTKMLYVES